MTRRHRLRGRRRIAAVRQQGFTVRAGMLRARVLARRGEPARVALAVPHAPTAVIRNRARRRLHAALAPLLAEAGGVDMLLSAPPEAASVPFATLRQGAGAIIERALASVPPR